MNITEAKNIVKKLNFTIINHFLGYHSGARIVRSYCTNDKYEKEKFDLWSDEYAIELLEFEDDYFLGVVEWFSIAFEEEEDLENFLNYYNISY